MVRLKGFEPLTPGLEGRCSIQLSYRCIHPSVRLIPCSLRKYSLHKYNGTALRYIYGAGDGNRTHAASLEGWNSTIELHPQAVFQIRRL